MYNVFGKPTVFGEACRCTLDNVGDNHRLVCTQHWVPNDQGGGPVLRSDPNEPTYVTNPMANYRQPAMFLVPPIPPRVPFYALYYLVLVATPTIAVLARWAFGRGPYTLGFTLALVPAAVWLILRLASRYDRPMAGTKERGPDDL